MQKNNQAIHSKRDLYSLLVSPWTIWPPYHKRYFKRIFFIEKVWILIKMPLMVVPKVRINNNPALVQIMARRRIGNEVVVNRWLLRNYSISGGLWPAAIPLVEKTEQYLKSVISKIIWKNNHSVYFKLCGYTYWKSFQICSIWSYFTVVQLRKYKLCTVLPIWRTPHPVNDFCDRFHGSGGSFLYVNLTWCVSDAL